MLKPKHLNSGDTIGVVAPAYPFPTENDKSYYGQFLKGKAELEKMGFKVKLGKNIGKVKWWTAGTPEEKAADINEMYADPEIKAIIAHDGANDCIRVIEHLDYGLIKGNPKPFIGFSNMTNIHSALYTKIGLVGFHMDMLTYGLGWTWQDMKPGNRAEGSRLFKTILTSPSSIGKIKPFSVWKCLKQGKAVGKLFGGNLSMLDSLVGTPYFPSPADLKGSIFFWEINNTQSFRIERILTHLKYCGLFNVIEGMMIGKLVDMKRSAYEGFVEPSLDEIILDNLKEYDFPILSDVDFGHEIVQIPMPIGIKAEMDATNLSLKYLESAVC